MKKNGIEKIASLPVKLIRNKKYKMIMEAQRVVIEKSPILICDFYYNRKTDIKKRWLRVVIKKNEYANVMSDGSWNTKKVLTKDYDSIWNVGADRTSDDWNISEKDIFVSEAAVETITAYAKKFFEYKPHRWYGWRDILQYMQDSISTQREQRKIEKEEAEKKRLISATDDSVPEEFKEWCKKSIPLTYLFYKRTDKRHAMINCSECGESYLITYRQGDSYEQVMCEEISSAPVVDCPSICKCCGAVGIYKQYGRCKNSTYGKKKTQYMIQPCEESETAVIRMFSVEKYLNTDYPARYSIIEKGRLYIGKKTYKKYWKRLMYSAANKCVEDWSQYNPGSRYAYEKDECGDLWYKSNIKDTFLRYSQIKEYASHKRNFRPYEYARVYKLVPELEMVMKLKMYKLADELVNRGSYILYKGSSITEKLGIDKKNFKELIRLQGNWDIVEIMRMEKEIGFDCIPEQREKLSKFHVSLDNEKLKLALKYMSIEKFINRIVRYAGFKEWPSSMTSCVISQIKNQIITYLDYLDMREHIHHDLINSVHQCPRFLKAAHDELVIIQNKKADEEYLLKKLEEYPDIAKNYNKWCKKYETEFAGMHIRPAADAAEIILEGRCQHHCVGKDEYLDKHNKGNSVILLLRHIECPQAAYVTIEIRGNKIVQWYGANDVKIDKKENEEWLKYYEEFLETRKVPQIKRIEVPLVAAV
ncbi:MAG: PcfJ domain-containing protein [Lachnospiraceae bacterium]|nr:PcfJ domain-containing protein [Lachnospiraceae bacterium]